MSQRETPPDKEYAEYDPVEGVGGFWRSAFGVTNTDIAATGAKINTHVPTPDEIAKHKYVIRRHLDALAVRHRRIFTEVIC